MAAQLALPGLARTTTDGFLINRAAPLPPVPPGLNEWSSWVPVKVVVMDFYINPAWVKWRGQETWVADYELFTMLIRQWMTGSVYSSALTKEAALDLFFEMAQYGEGNKKR